MAKKQKNQTQQKKEKEAKIIYIITNFFPLMKKELDRRKIKHNGNILDVLRKFIKEVLKKDKKSFENINEFWNYAVLQKENLDPVTIATIIAVAGSLITEIVRYFKNRKMETNNAYEQKEIDDTLSNTDKNIDNVDDIDENGNLITKDNKRIPIQDGQTNIKSGFTTGFSVAFVLMAAVVVLFLINKK